MPLCNWQIAQWHVNQGKKKKYLICINMFLLVNLNFSLEVYTGKIAHNIQSMKSTQAYERQTSWRWIKFWVLFLKMFPLILTM